MNTQTVMTEAIPLLPEIMYRSGHLIMRYIKAVAAQDMVEMEETPKTVVHGLPERVVRVLHGMME